jgi:hypothetical protein
MSFVKHDALFDLLTGKDLHVCFTLSSGTAVFELRSQHVCTYVCRVTRLGEFSPIERLSSSGSFFGNYGISPKMFGYFFPPITFIYKFRKNGLGNILGDFFSNSSGHLVCTYVCMCVCMYLSSGCVVKLWIQSSNKKSRELNGAGANVIYLVFGI